MKIRSSFYYTVLPNIFKTKRYNQINMSVELIYRHRHIANSEIIFNTADENFKR